MPFFSSIQKDFAKLTDELKAVTGYTGLFTTEPLPDVPNSPNYDSLHFHAVDRSESNDAAIKMAKLHTGGYEVVGLGGSWHGVTGTAGAVSYASDRKGYGPGMPGSFVIPEPNAYRWSSMSIFDEGLYDPERGIAEVVMDAFRPREAWDDPLKRCLQTRRLEA